MPQPGGTAAGTVAGTPPHATRRLPLPDELFLKCRGCGKTLAALVGGCFITKHHGRELVLDCPPVSLLCEGCGTVWNRPDLPDAEKMARVETVLRARLGLRPGAGQETPPDAA